jgi:hypothetical protein
MLERILSPRGYKIYIAVIIVVMGIVFWQLFTDSGLVDWFNRSAANDSDGYYYPGSRWHCSSPSFVNRFWRVRTLCDSTGYFYRPGKSDFANPAEEQDYTGYRKEVIDQVRKFHRMRS